MKEYFGILIAVALFRGIVGMLFPDGTVGNYAKLLAGLCLLCALLQPASELLREGLPTLGEDWLSETVETENYDEIYNQALQNGSLTQAEELVKIKVIQKFSLPSESFDVRVSILSKNEIHELEEIRICLRKQAALTDPRELVAFINEQYGCACVILYGELE